MIGLLIEVIIVGCIFAIIWWALQQIPLPPPFMIAARVILALIVVLFLLDLLAGGLGNLGGLHLTTR